MKRPTPILVVPIGFILGAVFWALVFPFVQDVYSHIAGTDFEPQSAVSARQIREIAGAISGYEKAGGERPSHLTELVEAGMLDEAALLDERRDEPKDGADVLYFPALRANDPGDLVLLCTLLIRREGDSFHVITNDGSYAAMSPRRLVITLNRTYRYLGAKIDGPRPTPRPRKESTDIPASFLP